MRTLGKSPLGTRHANNRLKKELSTDAKASGWQFDKEQEVYLVLEYLSADYLITKGKMRTYSRETWRMLPSS